MQDTLVQSLVWKDSLEEEMATCSSILAWKIPWTEEPGGLRSIVSDRVRHDWACIHLKKKLQNSCYIPGTILRARNRVVERQALPLCSSLSSGRQTTYVNEINNFLLLATMRMWTEKQDRAWLVAAGVRWGLDEDHLGHWPPGLEVLTSHHIRTGADWWERVSPVKVAGEHFRHKNSKSKAFVYLSLSLLTLSLYFKVRWMGVFRLPRSNRCPCLARVPFIHLFSNCRSTAYPIKDDAFYSFCNLRPHLC